MAKYNYTDADYNAFNTKIAKLEKLCKERADWETKELAASNKRRNAILAECYDIVAEFKKERKQQALLDQYLADKGVKVQSNTSLETKIVKMVFPNASRQSAHSYSVALRVALKRNKTSKELHTWIEAQGGIDAISLHTKATDETAQQKASRLRTYGIDVIEAQDALMTVNKTQTKKIAADVDADDFVLLLSIKQANGTMAVVQAVPDANKTLQNKALEAIGKKAEADGDAEKLKNKNKEDQKAFAAGKAASAKAAAKKMAAKKAAAKPKTKSTKTATKAA